MVLRGQLIPMLWIIVLPHNLVALELQLKDWRPDILLWDFLVESKTLVSINYCKLPRPWSSKQFCLPNSSTHQSTKRFEDHQGDLPELVVSLTVTFIWCKRGLQFLYCCSWVICGSPDESSLCSWRNFVRSANSGKVHYCAKLFSIWR